LNCLGADSQCDRQTDVQNYDNSSVHLTMHARSHRESNKTFIVARNRKEFVFLSQDNSMKANVRKTW